MSNKLLFLSVVVGILIPNAVLAEVVIQQAGSSATAIGNNNFAASSVNQSASQNQFANPNGYVDGSRQVTVQQAQSNAAAIGQNNVVVSDIEQHSVQNQYGSNSQQQAIQNAINNAAAIGQNNTIINSTGQYNLQNQWSY